MTDEKCKVTGCHEGLKLCLANKVSRKTLWIAILAIGIPLFTAGLLVWAGQESDPLRYVKREEMARHEKETVGVQVTIRHIQKAIDEINVGQNGVRRDIKDTQGDIKEILRHLRK